MNNRPLPPRHFLLPLFFLVALLAGFTLVFGQQAVLAEEGEPPAASEGASPWFSRATLTTGDATQLERIVINGPPVPPLGIARTSMTFEEIPAAAGIVLLPVPAYDWYYGCSATSAAMIAAFYDRNGFNDIYTGPTNGGVMPTDGRVWGVFADNYGGRYYQCPLTASRSGLDGRTIPGTIEDYWVYYYAPVATFPDPFITGGWTEHVYGDAIGDYMRTSQSTFSNADAMTTFYELPDGKLTTCDFIDDYVFDDGSVGRKLFYEARGYSVTKCYNQKTDNFIAGGFSFAQYMAEIDAGRPVLINVTGHSMVGIGYDSATNKVYLNDTWDNLTHTMPWGGSYSGMTMEAVSIVTLSMDGVDLRTLITSKNGSGGGSITSTPPGINCGSTTMDCFENYPTGTTVTLTATPSAGSYFTGWSGDCSGTGVCTLTMDEAHSVAATFEIYTLTVSKSGSGSGTVTSDPVGINCGSDCTENYPAGTVVTLTAAPSLGSSFTGWGGACSGTGTCVLTMDDSHSVTATFVSYILTVTKTGTGTGTVTSDLPGIDCGTDCSETYTKNTVVTLTAVPSPTSTFAGWSGACSGTAACVVTMDDSKSVTATFTIITYALNITKAGSGGGTVKSTPSGIYCGITCSYSFPATTVVTLSAWSWTSDFNGWSGACTGTGTCTVTMDSIKDVTATFTLRSYTLTVSKDGTGSGTVSSSPAGIDCGSDCSEVYSYGTSVTLSAAPAAGSSFTGWSGACTGTGDCTISVTAAKSVTATFTLDALTYDLTVSKTGTGSGTITSTPIGISCGSDCTETYPSGTSVTLAAAPSADSTFTGWSGACTGTGDCNISITAAQSVTATFTLDPLTYDLTVSKTGTGSGTITSIPIGISCGSDCAEAYPSGTSVTLAAAPSADSTFTGWSGACTGTGDCTISITAAQSVTATFTLNTVTYNLTVSRTGTGSGTITSSPIGITCGSDCFQAYAAGTVVKLTAVAASGSTFTGWTGACGGTSTSCWVPMSKSKSVTAGFISVPPGAFYLGVAKAGTGKGTVTSTPPGISCGTNCAQIYASGIVIKMTAVASPGSTFTGWSGACGGTGYCWVKMTATRYVKATFTLTTAFTNPPTEGYSGISRLINSQELSASVSFFANIVEAGGSPLGYRSAIHSIREIWAIVPFPWTYSLLMDDVVNTSPSISF